MSKQPINNPSMPQDNATNLSKTATVASIKSRLYKRQIHLAYLIIAVTLYLVASANIGFFEHVLAIYPFAENIGFIVSLTGLLFGLMWLLFQLLCYRPTAKIVLIFMVLTAAVCGYFTDNYGTVFGPDMLTNSLQTDQAEAMGLMAPSFVIRLLLLGILPAFIISKVRLKRHVIGQAILQKTATLIAAIALIAVCLLPFGDQYATFFVSIN